MLPFFTALDWIAAAYQLTGCALIVASGVWLFLSERRVQRRLANRDAQAAAARYRSHYGENALLAIGDHIVAASFGANREHRAYLKLVLAELLSEAVWPAQSVCSCFTALTIEIGDATPKRRGSSQEK